MKKPCFIIGLMVAFSAIFPYNLVAQSLEKGKTYISVGYGGLNLGSVRKREIINEGIVDIRMDAYGAIPLALQVEYGLTDQWSVGLAASYESYAYRYSFVPLFNSNGQRFNQTEDIEFTSAIARGGIHFGKKGSRFDPYLCFGLGVIHIGYNIDAWSWNEGYRLTGELKFGGRYFFSKNLGAHIELGLGTILLQTGLTAKF